MKAEEKLDHLVETSEGSTMRGQQDIAGQRAKVYSIRAELMEITMSRLKAGGERWKMLQEAQRGLVMAIKEADAAARAASRQASDDELRALVEAEAERTEARERFHELH